MNKTQKISVNIWDDFADHQETCIFIEDSNIEETKQKEILQFILDYITQNLNIQNVKLDLGVSKYGRIEIKITNFTHQLLNAWIEHFDKNSIHFQGTPINIYSES